MPTPAVHSSREAEALAEVAATRVTPAGAWTLLWLLLAVLVVGSAMEGARAWRGETTAFSGGAPIPTPREMVARWRSAGAVAAHRELREGLVGLEDRLGRESALSAALRPTSQALLARRLDFGNSQVVVGRDSWLYFRTEFEYLTGPPFLAPRELARRRTFGARYAVPEPDPIPGLLALHAELARRGIELVLFPVPVKAQIHPEPLVRFGAWSHEGAPNNPSFSELAGRLAEAGLPVYDALPELRAAALAGEKLYLVSDTHWNAAGMRIAAAGLAAFLQRQTALPERPPAGLRSRPFDIEITGDLTRLLDAGSGTTIFPDERIELDEVVGLGGVPYSSAAPAPPAPPPASDVLLLGDSYSLVFASAGGRSASFAEQLAFALDRPVRRKAQVAANNLSDRVHWLRREPELLDGVAVVVYEVSARAFVAADWTSSAIQPPRHKRRKP